MALKTILTAGTLLASIVFGVSQDAQAQSIHLPGARFEHRNFEQSDETLPLATPGIFDYDAQVFAPVEFVNDDQLEPRIGFYLSYDKTYLSLSGTPRVTPAGGSEPAGNNFTWGTRYNFGWYSENETGWAFSYQSNDGLSFPNGRDGLSATPTVVDTNFSSFELNRTFRQSSKRGTALEPYLGLRYFAVSDETFDDSLLGGLNNRFRQKATNSSIGFQAGARHSRRAGKWRFTTDGAVVTGYNQQRYTVLESGGPAFTTLSTADEDQAFVPAIDLEFDIAYNVTRDITLKTGVQLNYLWDGIQRANTETPINNPNSFNGTGGVATIGEDSRFIAAGFVFGFEWRR